MPELPEVEAVRRALAPVVRGARIGRVVLRRSGLRRPFPEEFERRVCGATVTNLKRRAKYLLADLSSGETLIMHLGMSGDFRVEPADHLPEPHDHVDFDLSSGRTIVFNDPRRFGVMDLVATGAVGSWPPLAGLGPEPLSRAFTAAALARACAGSKRAVKVALLDQRVVAGIGNIYASEALHLAKLLPTVRASSLATKTNEPAPAADRLAPAIKVVLERAIAHHLHGGSSQRFRVYDRAGERCLRRGCRGTITRVVQGARSTFFCPVCQRRR